MAVALILGGRCASVLANDTNDGHLGAGIHDVTDPELATMRGRFTVGDNSVVWFGVEMVSTFQTNSGQTVQGTMTLGMNFSKNPNNPQVTFVPTVTITTPDAPLPTAATVQSTVSRSIQSGAIASVGGLVQAVQIAGDNNATANVTSLNIQSGGSASNGSTTSNTSTSSTNSSSSASTASVAANGPMTNVNSSTTTVTPSNDNSTNTTASANTSPGSNTNTGYNTSNGRTATVGNASASSTYSNDNAEVTTSVAGEGSTSQWIHAGSLGQTIALTTDNAVVTNQMIVSLVTQQLGSTAQLAHSLAQSLNLSHLNGH
ncbi:hypothetical protein [Dyella caseinilytica]|uniref:Uncharacterized protein n=1 Tax=Dyella caseinilytica TaxID=1849581 RepID=A0ABX7GUS2_9GAMM|nr:hypothetical protein [Dyella caseinilytica]QRN54218.1 hypothetical protein ISN74_02130 [Dyella caseinilytica]